MLFAWIGLALAATEPPPVETGLTESVEVRLVTINVVALDRDERTVAGLAKDDFRLFVDGKPASVDTLDAFCDGGGGDDPKTKGFGNWATPPNLLDGVRRVVLVFDYLHLPSTPCPDSGSLQSCLYHTQSLRDYQEVLTAKTEVADEEIMVVALTTGLRIEQPFTRDRRAVVETLRRMEHDVTLWNGNFAHLTEFPLFSGLNALVTVLSALPGPKAIVLVSAGSGPGDAYEPDFRMLAARASEAQVAIYSHDCQGVYGNAAFT